MCGRMRAMWPISELMEWPSDTNQSPADPLPVSPAETLIEQLGLTRRTTAEVQDMYSRPIPAPALAMVPADTAPKRHPEPATERDLDAA
jgi:hypothetical protein